MKSDTFYNSVTEKGAERKYYSFFPSSPAISLDMQALPKTQREETVREIKVVTHTYS
jgi:hypothetical protein